MKIKNILAGSLLAIFAFSCQSDEEPTPDVNPFEEMTQIVSTKTGFEAYKMDVYMNEDPFVGFNYVFVDVYDSITGEKASDWGISYKPMMTMMMNGTTMKHTCPVEQPQYDAELKAFAGAAVFIMPSSEMANWSFEIKYENTQGTGSVTFSTTVVEKTNKALVSFVSSIDQKTYFIAFINPATPDVGINDFEVGIYARESMMSFPTVTGLTVEIEPEMPSMGHGSPDNVNPASMGNGHYKGSVNFTMTGLWHVNMTIEDQAANMLSEDKYFVIEF